MMRAKRHRDSLSPTRGSRGKGAWCCHPSKPPRHGLSSLRSILHTAVSSGCRRCWYRTGLQSSSSSCCATPTRARPAATTLLSSTSCELCRPCTSASRLMGRRNCCRACRCSTRFDETKIRSSRGCFRSSARLCRSAQEARKSRSMCKHGPRSKLLQKRDLEPMRHLKPDEGGGDPVSVMLNGSGGFLSAAARTPTR